MVIERFASGLPIRRNSDRLNIDAAWFNVFRSAIQARGCTKVTLSHEDFTAAAESQALVNANLILMPREQIEWVQMKHTVAFAGGSISAFTLKLGIASNASLYTPVAFDVFQAVGDTVRMRESFWDQPLNYSASTALQILGEATGDDVVNLTIGTCEIFLFTTTLP